MAANLKVSAPDGVKVYSVAGAKALPAWLSEKKARAAKRDPDYARRVELVQDLGFPTACQRLKLSSDGQFLMASGTHPPRVRVYELGQLSLKFERHLDAEVVNFQILTEDYSKAAFLCADRSVCLHAKYGAHYKTRIPRFGRDLAYVPSTAELVIVGSAPEAYRLNLSEGRFMTPLPMSSQAANAVGLSPSHGLLGIAGEGGTLECFDPRQRNAVGSIDAAAAAGVAGEDLTALRFDDTGLSVAVGTSGGIVALFDLRTDRPTVVKDHMYSSRITDIKFHAVGRDGIGGRKVISADTHIVKIWSAADGSPFTSIEPSTPGDINDVCVWPDSGLLMLARDSPEISPFFVPSLGPAPPWAAFLEGLTEELEEAAAPTVYDDYRFITRPQLEKLALGHLIGTPMLRAYMHGFFVDNRLYRKAQALAQPFAYETYRQQRIEAKLEAAREGRISMARKLPKVNAALAARALASQKRAAPEAEEGAADGEGPSKKARPGDLLSDPRFSDMFSQKEFEIDPDSEEYRILHPNAEGRERDKRLIREHFQPLSDEEEEEAGADAEDISDSDAEGASGSEEEAASSGEEPEQRQRQKGPRMYAARDPAAAEAWQRRESLAAEQSAPLEERAAAAGPIASASAPIRMGGSRELSFMPRRGGGRGGRGRSSSAGDGGRGGGRSDSRSSGGGGRGGGRGGGGRGGGGRGGGGRGGGGRGRSGGGGRGGGRGGRGRR